MIGWIAAFSILVIAVFEIKSVIEHRSASRARTSASPRSQPRPTPRITSNQESISPAQRTETGPMIYYANDRHGRRDREYRFNYININGSWRAYILRMPSLNGRDTSGTKTHRLWDICNKPYICWNRPVNSLSDMQTISRVWADSIQEYIATGKTFGPG